MLCWKMTRRLVNMELWGRGCKGRGTQDFMSSVVILAVKHHTLMTRRLYNPYVLWHCFPASQSCRLTMQSHLASLFWDTQCLSYPEVLPDLLFYEAQWLSAAFSFYSSQTVHLSSNSMCCQGEGTSFGPTWVRSGGTWLPPGTVCPDIILLVSLPL